MGHGAFPGTGPHRKLAFIESMIEITRPFLVVMGIPAVGMGAVLAAGLLPAPPLLLLGIIAVMFGVSATHAFNDWVDRRRDKTVWENRPIPAGRMPAAFAPVFALIMLAGSLAITATAFGMTAFVVLLVAEVLAAFYCMVLRDAVGYLSLPPIIALFPVGGWAAISPETLFSSWMPWFLAGIVLTWQAAHIMVYMPAHPISIVNGKPRCEKKALFFYPTPKLAAILGAIFSTLLLSEVVFLGVVAELGAIYWILAVPLTALTLAASLRLLASSSDKGRAIVAFNAASMALAFICGGVCLDGMVASYVGTFFGWAVQAAKDASIWVESQAASLNTIAYWVVLVVAALVTIASVGKVMKELSQKEPDAAGQTAGD